MRYADTSALAKLVLAEPESDALRAYFEIHGGPTSSSLVATELVRAVRRTRPDLESQAARLLTSMALIDVDRGILFAAGRLDPAALRSLDAIHLATALALGGDIEAMVTYDDRMAGAARAAGLRTEAPA